MHGTYKISNIDMSVIYIKQLQVHLKSNFLWAMSFYDSIIKDNFHFEHSENYIYILALLLTTQQVQQFDVKHLITFFLRFWQKLY